LSGAPPLAGLRVLAVEDEALIAMMLELMLEELGCNVISVVGTIEQALKKVETLTLDAAVLDVNLGGEKAFAVADALMERGVPFLFCTGYSESGLPEPYRRQTLINKPYTRDALGAALASLRSSAGR
jgi:CheY-like chemotaxis protein